MRPVSVTRFGASHIGSISVRAVRRYITGWIKTHWGKRGAEGKGGDNHPGGRGLVQESGTQAWGWPGLVAH